MRWVIVRQVFITRLKEQRYPTRAELDLAGPENPVLFATGPDASLNSIGTQSLRHRPQLSSRGRREVEKAPQTGEPTGILRNCARYIKKVSPEEEPVGSRPRPPAARSLARLQLGRPHLDHRPRCLADGDRSLRALHASGALPVRVAISHHIETIGELDKVRADIQKVASHPLRRGGPRLRIIGIKTYLDGGMLTGSAYMREPWGVSKIYAIDDPKYQGVLFIPHDRLIAIVRETVKSGLQFTAHSVGDGAVHALLNAYEETNKTMPIAPTRPCITHSNFMSREAIEQAARLGVVVDIQPAWLYLDTRTLAAHFGYDRLRYFQPLKSLFDAGVTAGGGSDHMQKIGSLRSINPYNPFLAMYVAVSRRAKGYEGQLHPEEALTREQAIRFYTINNARLMFLEDRIGSLEAGKQADFVVIDRDLLTCPEDEIKDTRALATYLDGKRVSGSLSSPVSTKVE